MLTGRLSLAAGLLVVAACHNAPHQPQAAWWYDIEFAPDAASVRGISVSSMMPEWRSARDLTDREVQDRISRSEFQNFKASPFAFNTTADLNRDGSAEDFFVGVFKASDGSTGRFAAVTKNHTVLKVFQERGKPGFSALLKIGDAVRWYKCMDCGEFETITWTGTSYLLE